MSPQRTSVRNCSSALVRMRPRHMSAVLSSSTRKPIDTTLSVPARRRSAFGTRPRSADLAVGAAEAAVDAEHARDAEAPDVGVEDADGEPARRERGGEVHGDRRLADAALAARDREHARGRRRPRWARRARGRSSGRAASPPTSAPGSSRRSRPSPSATPGRPRDLRLDVLAGSGARSGQPGGGERDLDRRRRRRASTATSSTMPRSTMLAWSSGSMTPGQHAADVVGRRRGARDGLVDRGARVVGVEGRAHHTE